MQKSELADYSLMICSPEKINESDVLACLKIIKNGAAVATTSATKEIPKAYLVVIVRKGNIIVGIGSIKRSRPQYNKKIGQRADTSLSLEILEIGYIAIDPSHRGKGLSSQIICKLTEAISEPLFATTDDVRMKHTLAKYGFTRKGREWKGNRGNLSLWIRE